MENISSKRAKALSIPKHVKDAVWERDHHACVYCGTPYAFPEAHYIPRSRGGLGIEENILTLCRRCHYLFDSTDKRDAMKFYFANYLRNKYPGWDEKNLIYKKE